MVEPTGKGLVLATPQFESVKLFSQSNMSNTWLTKKQNYINV